MAQVFEFFDLDASDRARQLDVTLAEPSQLLLEVTMDSPLHGFGANQHGIRTEQGCHRTQCDAAQSP